MRHPQRERDIAIRFLHGNGVSKKEIAAHYGISRARVSQIVRFWQADPKPPSPRGVPPLTPKQRSLRARIGALRLHATGGTTTEAARAQFAKRFASAADPEAARRAYFADLALRSSRARSRRRPTP